MRNGNWKKQKQKTKRTNERKQVTYGTHQQPGHTYIHACIHTHTPRALGRQAYTSMVSRIAYIFLLSLTFFSLFFLYSISFLHFAPCSYYTFMGRRMDGWMYSNKPRGGWLHTKDMAVHVWTGVDVENFYVCWLLTSLVVIFFSSLPFCFFLMSCVTILLLAL